MKRVLALTIAAALVLPYAALAQAKPDFSGTWTLDAAKSDPPPARGGGGGGGGRAGGGGGGRAGGGGGRGGGGPVTITQSATEITIGMQTYKLDGSEVELMGRGGVAGKGKAMWQGNNLVIEQTRDFQGNSITTKEVRSLSGNEMTVVTTTSTPAGEQTRKTVYTKG
jgi:hypothetical protein